MRKLALMAAAAVLLGAASAKASTPEIVFDPTQFNIQAGPNFSATPATETYLGDSATGGFSPGGPFVHVTGSAPGVGVSATATWQFEVTGGNPGDLVPIIFTGAFDASSTGGGIASGGLADGLFNSSLTYLKTFNCTGGAGSCGAQPFTIHTFAESGFLMSVLISAGGFTPSGGGSFSSNVDPQMFFDFDLNPNFDFSPFTLHVAPDAQPPTGGGNGIPEPASWALMILGFGVVGASLRVRRPAVA